jgi:hypothetical protein
MRGIEAIQVGAGGRPAGPPSTAVTARYALPGYGAVDTETFINQMVE